MASRNPTCSTFLIFFFVSTTLVCALRRPGRHSYHRSSSAAFPSPVPSTFDAKLVLQVSEEDKSPARLAPICTYNECRGCRFKCSAEQVPVDAGDPMNSAYRYRCVYAAPPPLAVPPQHDNLQRTRIGSCDAYDSTANPQISP
ncbi:hypothetical protein BHE74_00020270 [Ensete ventricosum]|nr:hypothetical protein BHE74_00020270 [Ensete ventricosum]